MARGFFRSLTPARARFSGTDSDSDIRRRRRRRRRRRQMRRRRRLMRGTRTTNT